MLLVLLFAPGAGAATPSAPFTILVLGDSLSAAYGMSPEQGWVHLLQQRLARSGRDYRVVNASISGETTSGGLARLSSELERHDPALVIVELGGNDGLRGLPLAQIRDNLSAIITAVQARPARVLLAGMQLPPNYGGAYTTAFHHIFTTLAAEKQTGLVPFLLAGLEHDDRHFQADGIHPTAAVQPLILENLWPALAAMLDTADDTGQHAAR